MSRAYEFSYSLAEVRREAMIRATTERYYERYLKEYQGMINKGYLAYIPSEMERLKRDLEQIRDLLVSSPIEAQTISFEIGRYIFEMSHLAELAVKRFEVSERMRVEKLKEDEKESANELLMIYYSEIKKIKNPMVINFAHEELEKVKNDIKNGKQLAADKLKKQIEKVVLAAETKTLEWKKTAIEKQKVNVIADKLEKTKEMILNSHMEDSQKTQQFVEKINKLKEGLTNATTNLTETEKEIINLETDFEETSITEDMRRETVKAIIKELKSQEFIVEKPQIINNGDSNYVKIIAKKASGKRAICNVDLNGKIAYKFDNYDGMTCMKDIEKFNVDLQKIYSIKLSDERILWNNPNKISKEADRMPFDKGRNA